MVNVELVQWKSQNNVHAASCANRLSLRLYRCVYGTQGTQTIPQRPTPTHWLDSLSVVNYRLLDFTSIPRFRCFLQNIFYCYWRSGCIYSLPSFVPIAMRSSRRTTRWTAAAAAVLLFYSSFASFLLLLLLYFDVQFVCWLLATLFSLLLCFKLLYFLLG